MAETCFPISNQSSTGNLDKDGGDCAPFKYPNCIIYNPFSTDVDYYGDVVLKEPRFGDGYCDPTFNTEECGWDDGDCPNANYPDCTVIYPDLIGDGVCDGAPYNTAECGWDGGDCVEFNKYPDCTVNNPVYIGNGQCNYWAPYNTAQCGYDGGDCLP